MIDFGIVKPGITLYVPFDSFAGSTGASSATTGLAVGDIKIYKNGSVTERSSTNGFTLLDTDGLDFDGITGINGFSISLADNSDAGFYAAGADYFLVISSVTVDSQTVNFVAARWTIGYADAWVNTTIATLTNQTTFTLTAGPAEDDALNGCIALIHDVASGVQIGYGVIADYTGATKTVLLAAAVTFTAATTDNVCIFAPHVMPTVAGRTLDISATGEAGIDWANIGSPTTTVALSGTTVKTATDVETDTQDIQSRLPAALVSGRIDASVGAMAAAVLTAAAIAAGAITNAKFAAGAIDAAAIADNAIDAATLATGTITAAKFAASAIDAAAIADGAIDAGAIAAGAITAAKFAAGAIDAAAIADGAIDAATLATGTITAAKFAAGAIDAAAIADNAIDAGAIAADAITAAKIADNAIDAGAIAADAITAAKIATGAIDADAIADNAIDAGAIATGAITAAKFAASAITSTVIAADAIGASQIAADAIGASELAASAVTEIQNGLASASDMATVLSNLSLMASDIDVIEASIGALPTDNSIAAAVWDQPQAANTNPGSFGELQQLLTRLTSARAGYLDNLNVGGNVAAQADLATLATSAQATTIIGLIDTEIAAILAAVDTEVAAIKAKTDNLPAAPAAVGDIPTAAQNADKLLGRNIAGGSDGGRIVTDVLRLQRNRRAIAAGTLTVYQEDDSTPAWTAAVTTAASNPIASVDPA